MSSASLAANSSIRLYKDRFTRYSITLGGLMVLMTLLMIFGYLLYVVEPIFRDATIEPTHQQPITEQSIAFGTDELNEIGYFVDQQANVNFYPLVASSPQANQYKLPVSAPVVSNTKAGTTVALGLENGHVLLVQPNFSLDFSDGTRRISANIRYPLIEPEVLVDEQQAALEQIALQIDEEQMSLVALTADNRLLLTRLVAEENMMTEELEWVTEQLAFNNTPQDIRQILLSPDQRLMFVLSANQLYVYDLLNDDFDSPQQLLDVNEPNSDVTAVSLLSGGSSILVGNSNGVISQWFEVNGERGRRLTKIREFTIEGAVTQIEAEPSRKTFAALNNAGQFWLFHTTSEAELLNEQLASDVEALRFTPRNNGLIADNGKTLHLFHLENEHPEVSWSALWQEVWYEGYPEPDYVWQSTSASDEFEPKLSLVPISFGTIKAALFAMLFAVPIAIAGAIYTAYFMPSNLRKVVKPTVETMEALPTVILGFLAGLWLAPIVEENLPFVFLLILLIPITIVLTALAYHNLPKKISSVLKEEYSTLFLIPIVLLVSYFAMQMSPIIEANLLGGDARTFISSELGIGFDQRNALVVGLAMGFAVIPTIFSITEDAIFSVPKHLSNGSLALGATRWQTLVGVVLLTASPGIFSAVMMGLGRAVGETMIVLMATGNTPIMDWNIFEGMRSLSANIAVEMPESEVDSTHYRVLFLAAFVLFIFTFFFNTIAELVRQRLREKYGSL